MFAQTCDKAVQKHAENKGHSNPTTPCKRTDSDAGTDLAHFTPEEARVWGKTHGRDGARATTHLPNRRLPDAPGGAKNTPTTPRAPLIATMIFFASPYPRPTPRNPQIHRRYFGTRKYPGLQAPAGQPPRSVSRSDLPSYSCRSSRAAASNDSPAGSPTLQHPPFPRPWCEPPNRVPCVAAARTGGPTSMHQSRPLSPPGCLRTRLRIPPSLSWRNIGACRSPGPPNTCLVARISSVDA